LTFKFKGKFALALSITYLLSVIFIEYAISNIIFCVMYFIKYHLDNVEGM